MPYAWIWTVNIIHNFQRNGYCVCCKHSSNSLKWKCLYIYWVPAVTRPCSVQMAVSHKAKITYFHMYVHMYVRILLNGTCISLRLQRSLSYRLLTHCQTKCMPQVESQPTQYCLVWFHSLLLAHMPKMWLSSKSLMGIYIHVQHASVVMHYRVFASHYLQNKPSCHIISTHQKGKLVSNGVNMLITRMWVHVESIMNTVQ